jgi:hypothetical protein
MLGLSVCCSRCGCVCVCFTQLLPFLYTHTSNNPLRVDPTLPSRCFFPSGRFIFVCRRCKNANDLYISAHLLCFFSAVASLRRN